MILAPLPGGLGMHTCLHNAVLPSSIVEVQAVYTSRGFFEALVPIPLPNVYRCPEEKC